jgi:altronate hydrolase
MVADWFTEQRLVAYPRVDGVLPFVHELGCGMEKTGEPMDLLRRSLGGTIRNPNLAGAVVMALGCDRNNIYAFMEQEGLVSGPMLHSVVLQEVGGTARAVEQGIAAVQAMLPQANQSVRSLVPVGELVVGLQTEGVLNADLPARQALGAAVDKLVSLGGTVIASSTRSNAPALLERNTSPGVRAQLEQRVVWWKGYAAGRDTRSNRRPDRQVSDGVHTGTAPVQMVLNYAQPLATRGLVLMDAPGYAPVSATGQVASGATLICELTGSGSGFGAAGAPTLRWSTSANKAVAMAEEMDGVLDGTAAMSADTIAMGDRIFDSWLRCASGQRTQAEQMGLGDCDFVPWPVGVFA